MLPYPTSSSLSDTPKNITLNLNLADGTTYDLQNISGNDIFLTEHPNGTDPTAATDAFIIHAGDTIWFKQVSGRVLWAWAGAYVPAASLVMAERAA